jgi:uncharacterized repeat protein (TIGR04076 family)
MAEERARSYTVEVTLVKGMGTCAAGHKIGDRWVFPGNTERFICESGICIHALASMFPKLFALHYGARFPWLKEDPNVALHLCPDAQNPHVFQLRRIPE